MAIHASLIILVLIGILISVRYKKYRPIESSLLLSAVIIWSIYGGCPLTYLENYLRVKSGESIPILKDGFISYYIEKIFSLNIPDKIIVITTYLVCIIFLLISIEWITPYVNPVLFRMRKFIKNRF